MYEVNDRQEVRVVEGGETQANGDTRKSITGPFISCEIESIKRKMDASNEWQGSTKMSGRESEHRQVPRSRCSVFGLSCAMTKWES